MLGGFAQPEVVRSRAAQTPGRIVGLGNSQAQQLAYPCVVRARAGGKLAKQAIGHPVGEQAAPIDPVQAVKQGQVVLADDRAVGVGHVRLNHMLEAVQAPPAQPEDPRHTGGQLGPQLHGLTGPVATRAEAVAVHAGPAQVLHRHRLPGTQVIDRLMADRAQRTKGIAAQGEGYRQPRRDVEALAVVTLLAVEVCPLDIEAGLGPTAQQPALSPKAQGRQHLKGVVVLVAQILEVEGIGPQLGVAPGLDRAGSGACPAPGAQIDIVQPTIIGRVR